MSNRNFDASQITKRNANKTIAKNIISHFGGTNPYFFQPLISNFNQSVINEVKMGNSEYVSRGDTCTTVDLGCPCSSNGQRT